MFGRLSTTFFVALCLLATDRVSGQSMPGGPGHGHPGAIAPAGYPMPMTPPGAYPGPPPGYGGMPPQYQPEATEVISKNTFLWDMWQWDKYLLEAVKSPFWQGTWVETEFLMWTIENPGNTLLGEQLTTVGDPRLPASAFEGDSPPIFIGFSRVPHLDNFRFRDTYGLRMTYGVPLSIGHHELSGFVLEKASHSESATELPSSTVPGMATLVGTSTFVDGMPSNNAQRFDHSFDARMTSKVWGVNSRIVFDMSIPGRGLKFNPILGSRIVVVNEELLQRGVFTDFGRQAAQHSLVGGEAKNVILGVDLGFVSEFDFGPVTIGARPTFSVGPNFIKARTRSERFTSLTDPFRDRETRRVAFSPIFELKTYFNVHLTEQFTIKVGYNLMWIAQVQRAPNTLVYDINSGPPPTSAVTVQKDYKSLNIHGLILGCEYRF